MPIVAPALRHTSRLLPRVALGLTLFAIVACADTKAPERSASGTASAADSITPSGVWSEADEQSTWTATRDDANTWRIDETAQFGEDGRATRRFLFDSTGTLRAVSERKEQTAQTGNATPALIRAVLEVEFTDDSATRISKQVDGSDRDVQPFEIENSRRHAQALWTLARRSAHRG